jgi:proteasome lid subunit RPN8/RPN11
MKIQALAYRDIRAHGEQTYPQESCGVLLGRLTTHGWDVLDTIRATNVCLDESVRRYQISTEELVNIQHRARNAHLEIAGFYHSHPDHPATWSPTDYEEAHWLGCLYMITSIEKRKTAATNCYLLLGNREENKRFEVETIQVEEQQ